MGTPFKMKGWSPFTQTETTKEGKTSLGGGYEGDTPEEKCANLCKQIAEEPETDFKKGLMEHAKEAGCGCG